MGLMQCMARRGTAQNLNELHDEADVLKEMGGTPRQLLHLKRISGKPCGANSSVQVSIKNSTNVLSAMREMESGTYSAVSCRTVDPQYAGAIWLVCNAGVLNATGHCFVNATAAECAEQRNNLQLSFVKAYVELARLVSEF